MTPIMIPALLAVLIAGSGAVAEESLAVRGVFCRSETQIRTVQEYMRTGLPPRVAAGMMNRNEVACVYADRIHYVVVRPAIIDGVRDGAGPAYRATLTGVRVGDSLRPIDPPLPIFFVTPDPIEGAVYLGNA